MPAIRAAYFDSSILIKRYIRVNGSDRALALTRQHLIISAAIAPLEMRIQRLAAGSGMEPAEAAALIAETDKQRAQFIQENFQQMDAQPLLYDLVINTGRLALETAAELVVRAVGAKFPQVLEIQPAGTHQAGHLPSASP